MVRRRAAVAAAAAAAVAELSMLLLFVVIVGGLAMAGWEPIAAALVAMREEAVDEVMLRISG